MLRVDHGPRQAGRGEAVSKRKSPQLLLEVRLYRVKCDGFVDYTVQAASSSAAKYKAFKSAREAGYFRDPRTAFRDFLHRGFRASEVRR